MGVPMGPWLVGFRGQIIPLFIVGDVISDNWDGLIPPNLSGTGPDLTATQGYALDASAGSAQFNGRLFVQGELKVGENADVFIGGPGSTDAQLFIDNTLQHINLRETDDPNYPDIVWIHDVNGGMARLIHLDASGPTFTQLVLYSDDGFLDINQPAGGLMRAGLRAYVYKESVVYTASDTFTKADYDGFAIAKVKVQGAGGGGGGSSAPAAGSASIGGAGGGGAYSESWVLESDFDTTEAVTVGAGGNGGAAGNNNGTAGGATTVDTISGSVTAAGGGAGQGNAAFTPLTGVPGNPGSGGSGGGGNLRNMGGGDGSTGFALAANRLVPGIGGSAFWAPPTTRSMVGGSTTGAAGANWGGGALGGFSVGGGAASAGGAGGDGRVEIEIWT